MGVGNWEDGKTIFQSMEDDLMEEIESGEDRVRELDMQAETANIPKSFAKVHTPTPEEFAKHCLTHLPYRSWCPICVRSKKRNPRHQRVKEGRGGSYIFYRLHVLKW